MKTKMYTILHGLQTAGKTIWKAMKTGCKAVWKALRFASRPFLFLAQKIRALAQRVWRSRKTHPAAWKKAAAASMAVLLAANIAMSAVFVAYSVRTRNDSERAMYYAVSTANSAVKTADAARTKSEQNNENTIQTLENWKYRESVYTGTLGDNLTWEIDPEAASLTISGTGEMDERFDKEQKPAFAMLYKNVVRTIYICRDVTSIAPYAFEDFTALETVNLGAGMEEIGDGAFYGCSSLSTVRTGNTSLKTIGEDAFYECYKLKNMFLPKTFETFNTPSDVNRIRFSVDEENRCFLSDEDGCLYTDDGKTLLYCPVGTDSGYDRYPDYTIPDRVNKLDTYCFRGNHFRTLTIPGTVRSVFLDGAALEWTEKIILCQGVERLDTGFMIQENYRRIGTLKIPDTLKTIDETIYSMIDDLELSDTHPTLMKTKDGSIYSQDGKILFFVKQDTERTSFTVREGTVRIAEGATGNLHLTGDTLSVSLPDSLRYIGSYNFNGLVLPKGKTLTLPRGLERIGDYCFTSMTVSKIRVPESVEYIGEDFLLYTNDTRCTEEMCKEGKTVVVFGGSEEELERICENRLPNGVILQCED